MREAEPPSTNCPLATLFFVGKNSRGQWIVQDQRHLCGGLFVSRADAIRFALFESGNRPEAVVNVPVSFELDMNTSAALASRSKFDAAAVKQAA